MPLFGSGDGRAVVGGEVFLPENIGVLVEEKKGVVFYDHRVGVVQSRAR